MRGKRFVYGSYRGRRSTTDVLKTVALILAVLVVLAVAGVWMAQKYIVYDDGGYHLELPFFQKEGPDQEPEDFRVAVEPAASQPEETPEEGEPLLAAVTVPLSAVEDGSAEALAAQAGANSVLLDMKTDRGQLGFISQLAMAASAGVNAGQADINRQLQALNSGELYTVARLAKELGISRKELQSRTVSLPAYRAMYLDSVLKEGPGVAYYRDQLMKALVRGLRSVEDSDYPVPERLQGVLREYQKTGFHWLKTLDVNGFGGILADDMGLGKTIQTIALLEDAYGGEQKEQEPSLIVCPASLVYNWEHEIRKFAPDLTIRSVVGNAGEREEILREACAAPGGISVFITSYDLLKRDVEQYGELHFRFQIIDEAQYIKNAATQSARAVKAVNASTRFALTGTPVENRLGELWSIFDYLMPGFLFGAQHFRKEYELPIVRDQDGEALERLRRITGPFILRRVKKDVLRELPDKLETVVYSRMEEEQKNLYAAGAAKLKECLDRSEGEGLGEERFQVLADLTRLRQICCDPRLCYENYKGGSAKLETCMDLVRRGVEGEHKILLFSQFTSMLELIESRLNQEGIASYKLTGATSKEERMRLVGEFASDATPVFLISLKAGGTGLNLTAADIVIHYDPWWNVAAQNQATDRSHRIGQDKQVTVFKLIARNTVEENILTLQESKSRLSDQVITGDGGSFGGLTREDILRILA